MRTITDYFLEFGECKRMLDQNFKVRLVSPAMVGVTLTLDEDPSARKFPFPMSVRLAPLQIDERERWWWMGACWTPDGSAHVFYGDQ